jgi:uncharacterized protein YkwD
MFRFVIITAIIILASALLFTNPIRSYASLSTLELRLKAQEEKARSITHTKRGGQIHIVPTATPTPAQKVLAARAIRKKLKPTATPTLVPTKKPTATPRLNRALRPTATPTVAPLATVTLKPTKIPTATPTPTQTTVNTSDLVDSEEAHIMKEINEYRATQKLSAVTPNKETCDFAKVRAEEISHNFNHDGFTNRVNDKKLPYSGYGSVTENIAMNSDYADVTDRWIASSGHAENMRKDTPFVCVKKHGNYYAYEGWRP